MSDLNFLNCLACKLGRSQKLHFFQSESSYTTPLQLVQVDIQGPAPIVCHGNLFYICFVDSYSHFTWIYFPTNKSNVARMLASFQTFEGNQLNHTLKGIQTNNEGDSYMFFISMWAHVTLFIISHAHTHHNKISLWNVNTDMQLNLA